MSAQPAKTASNTQTIARNSFWYGLELAFSILGAFLVSVIVARAIGPTRLGYYNYVLWLTTVTASMGSLGLPLTARKYMAEYLNRGEAGVARAIYQASVRLQALVAAGATAIGLALVFTVGDPSQRLVSSLLVLSVGPRVMGFLPSQANSAAEQMKRNTQPALVAGTLNIVLTLLSVWLGWDLVGIAAAYAGCAALETVLKMRSVNRLLHGVEIAAISPELRKRLLSYSGQALALMILNTVVWDKSDVIVLKAMNPQIEQVTFFTMAFNLTDRILTMPWAFGNSLGATMMAQYGRSEAGLHQLAVVGARYTFLLALPLLLGMASVAAPMVPLLFGHRYDPMILVLEIVALMALGKALMVPAMNLLQTVEAQGFLIWTGCLAGVLDIGLDFALTPTFGARGAALANGVAQAAAMIAIWIRARHLLRLDLRLGDFGRIALSGAGMAAVVVGVGQVVHGPAGLALQVLSGVVAWVVMLRLTGAIDKEDGARLARLADTLPAAVRPTLQRMTGVVVSRR